MQISYTSLQTTIPAPHHSFATGWMPFLTPNQQCQSIEGIRHYYYYYYYYYYYCYLTAVLPDEPGCAFLLHLS